MAVLVTAFWVARALGVPRRFALLTPVALASLPNFEFHSKFVMPDMPQLALALAGTALIGRFARDARLRHLLCGGALLGLACAVKLSAATFVVGAMLGLLVRPSWTGWWRILAALGTGAIASACFVLVNPDYHRRPAQTAVETIRGFRDMKLQQVADPILAPSRVSGPAQASRLLLANAVLGPETPLASPPRRPPRSRPLLAPTAAVPVAASAGLAALLLAARSLGWPAALALALVEAARGADLSPFALPILLGIGVALARSSDPLQRLWLMVCLATYVITAAWLPLDWPRYYLPLAAAALPYWSLGLAELLRRYTRWPERWAASRPCQPLAA